MPCILQITFKFCHLCLKQRKIYRGELLFFPSKCSHSQVSQSLHQFFPNHVCLSCLWFKIFLSWTKNHHKEPSEWQSDRVCYCNTRKWEWQSVLLQHWQNVLLQNYKEASKSDRVCFYNTKADWKLGKDHGLTHTQMFTHLFHACISNFSTAVTKST